MSITEILQQARAKQYDRFANTINPQLTKVLRTLGFDQHFVRGEGAYLFNETGERFLDCLSGYGVFNIGRNHPRVKAYLNEALSLDDANMVQMDAPVLAGALAEHLLEKIAVPNIDTIFFTNSGTEAVEAALKFAKCATKRAGILHCNSAFHGLTNGSLSTNGNDEFRSGFEPLLPNTQSVPFGDLNALEVILRSEQYAAFIVEPIQGKGVYTADASYFDQAIRLCRKYGTLFIVDEVQTGFGRTGKCFAYQHWNETPDMVCVAKALSGGFIPVGAVAYPRAVYKKVFSSLDRCVVHSNTFGRNTLAMTAGIATLEVIEQENLIANAAARGDELLMGLRALADKYEMLSDVRGQGLMIGLEFSKPQSLKLRAGWEMVHKLDKGLFGQLLVVPLLHKHKILTQVAGHNTIIKLLPSLTLTTEDVQWLLSAFDDVIAACHTFPGAAWNVGKDLAKRALSA